MKSTDGPPRSTTMRRSPPASRADLTPHRPPFLHAPQPRLSGSFSFATAGVGCTALCRGYVADVMIAGCIFNILMLQPFFTPVSRENREAPDASGFSPSLPKSLVFESQARPK